MRLHLGSTSLRPLSWPAVISNSLLHRATPKNPHNPRPLLPPEPWFDLTNCPTADAPLVQPPPFRGRSGRQKPENAGLPVRRCHGSTQPGRHKALRSAGVVVAHCILQWRLINQMSGVRPTGSVPAGHPISASSERGYSHPKLQGFRHPPHLLPEAYLPAHVSTNRTVVFRSLPPRLLESSPPVIRN